VLEGIGMGLPDINKVVVIIVNHVVLVFLFL